VGLTRLEQVTIIFVVRFLKLVVILFLLLQAFCLAEAEKSFHFDPAVVELVGKLEIQTFPGPPGYQSVKNGDQTERGWFLRLSEPITIVANSPSTDLGWQTEKNVKILHMVIDWDHIKAKDLVVGGLVRVRGKLFNRQNGHHHTRVLVEASELNRVSD